jgi:hypothetical protein
LSHPFQILFFVLFSSRPEVTRTLRILVDYMILFVLMVPELFCQVLLLFSCISLVCISFLVVCCSVLFFVCFFVFSGEPFPTFFFGVMGDLHVLVTHGRWRFHGFLPQLDEFYFTTVDEEIFEKLKMYCSEFHELCLSDVLMVFYVFWMGHKPGVWVITWFMFY